MIIYIASSKKYVGVIQEDIYIRDEYISGGISSEIATLDDIIQKSKLGDIVILKSIWGYHVNYKTFLNQILILRNKGVRLINNYEYILWNIDKSKYLIETKELKIIPTYLLKFSKTKTQSDIINLINKIIPDDKNSNYIIKPAVSASGYLTFLYYKNNITNLNISLLSKNKDLVFIIQPYRPQIIDGEISVIIINGQIKYAVNRFPGIFTEKKYIIYIKLSDVPKLIIEQVNLTINFLIKKFRKTPKICRVDFLKHNLDYEIIEIELIDPDLFLRYIPEDIRKKSVSSICNDY